MMSTDRAPCGSRRRLHLHRERQQQTRGVHGRASVRNPAAVNSRGDCGGGSGARVLSETELAATRWLRFVDLQYVRGEGQQPRTWQACQRSTTKPGTIDAVAVFSVITRAGREPQLLVVKQFRPPVGRCVSAGPTSEIPARNPKRPFLLSGGVTVTARTQSPSHVAS